MAAKKPLLRCKPGYRFRSAGAHTAMLVRGNTQTGVKASCGCSKDGQCNLEIGRSSISCVSDECEGTCSLTISVAGLSGAWMARKA
jgi:hypothetical protein